MIWVAIAMILGCFASLGGMMFAFHCGFIYGRYGISAYEYHKRQKSNTAMMGGSQHEG